MRLILFSACLLLTNPFFAQNTIGGKVKIVPEAEVALQSDFVLAERELILEHWGPALELYKKFTYENPANDAGWYGLARCYAQIEDWSNAQNAIAKAIVLAPQNSWYLLYQIDLFEKTGRYKDALKNMETLTKKNPKQADFWDKLAYICLLNDDPKAAIKALDKVENLLGISETSSEKKHLIYEQMGDFNKAALELKKLADAFPNEIQYRKNLAEYYQSKGDMTNAGQSWEMLLKMAPNDPDAKLAMIRKSSTGNSTAILNLFPVFENPQVPIDAKLKEAIPYLDKIKKNSNDTELAKNVLDLGKTLCQTHPSDPKAFSFLGAVLYLEKQPEAALEAYRQCIRLNPNVFGAWENTLSILEELTLYPEMESIAAQAIEAFPNQPRAYLYFGIAAIENAHFDDAQTQLEQARLMAGNSPIALDINDQLAYLAFKKKDYPTAEMLYEALLNKGGAQNPGILEHYGDLLSALGKPSEARNFWQKAYDLKAKPALIQKIKKP
ncbi:MAG: tetratricopeptide repeat protein [Bacteroidetes bacterium]|nr:tetratricopeptide repeat protein [Bacteroidota bacterium]